MTELPPEGYVVVGGDVDSVNVSVRVAGDQLDPDEVTTALATSPTFAARKGERRLSGGREVVQRTGVWLVDFRGAPEEWTLADAINELLNRLPADNAVWERLAAKYVLDVSCGLYLAAWNRGFALPPALLRRLAERHLELNVDIYCNGPRDAAT
jgi:hypothetical protein